MSRCVRSPALVVATLATALSACQCDDQLDLVPGALEGRACDPVTGLGLAGVVVEARGKTAKQVVADGEGRFLLSGLVPGDYDVVALLADGGEHKVGDTTTVTSGDTVPVIDTACTSEPGEGGRGTLEGQVCNRHTGQLITDAEVLVLLSSGELMTSRTDAEGRFSVAEVPEGDHVVTLRAPGFQRSFPVTIEPGRTVTLDLADGCEPPSSTSGAIAGEFCDPTTDGPLAGADVTIHRNDPPSTPDEDIHELTDTDGRFFFDGLIPGEYRVDVEKDGVPPVTALVDVVSGETGTVVGPDECARRTPVGRIEGQICNDDPNDPSVDGGRFQGEVELLQGTTRIDRTTSDAEGRFDFNAVPPGVYDLHAFNADYDRVFRAIVVEPFQTAFVQESNCPEPEDVCTPFTHRPDVQSDGRILFVVDRSGSMAQAATGFNGLSKLDALRNALQRVTTSLASTVTYGLFAYPDPANDGAIVNCGTGVQRQAVGASAAQINNAMNQLSPNGGTPTAQSVLAAKAVLPALVADGRPIAVVLATDGAPNCATTDDTAVQCICTSTANGQSNQSCARFNCLDDLNSANAVAQIAALGVQTHVIGIRGVDEATLDGDLNGVPDFTDALNKMAIAGEAPLAGPIKFHEALNTEALERALDAITRRILACKVTVPDNLNTASSVSVRLGDEVLPQDITRRDGWDITGPNTVELFGAACDDATASLDDIVVTRCVSP